MNIYLFRFFYAERQDEKPMGRQAQIPLGGDSVPVWRGMAGGAGAPGRAAGKEEDPRGPALCRLCRGGQGTASRRAGAHRFGTPAA